MVQGSIGVSTSLPLARPDRREFTSRLTVFIRGGACLVNPAVHTPTCRYIIVVNGSAYKTLFWVNYRHVTGDKIG